MRIDQNLLGKWDSCSREGAFYISADSKQNGRVSARMILQRKSISQAIFRCKLQVSKRAWFDPAC